MFHLSVRLLRAHSFAKIDRDQVIMMDGGVIPRLRPAFSRRRNAWMQRAAFQCVHGVRREYAKLSA
jgi:hypothetical protein